MGFMGRKSVLKSDTIKKVILNKKDYVCGDFSFTIKKEYRNKYIADENDFAVEVYDFDCLILKVYVEVIDQSKGDKRFRFWVYYFNPQTDNDCYSINHIIAVMGKELSISKFEGEDLGNIDVFNNQFIFRKKDGYYTYTKIWTRGEIKDDNFDKSLTYEFATNEYISFIRNIYNMKKITRRAIKKQFRGILDKIIVIKKMMDLK